MSPSSSGAGLVRGYLFVPEAARMVLPTGLVLDNRFWRQTTWVGHCLEWTGNLSTKGYGALRRTVQGRSTYYAAHRYAWELVHGSPPPANKVLMHLCDNPRCVNVCHLAIGTIQDNVQDMVMKRRHAHSERAHNAIRTEADVLRIRKLCSDGATYADVAKEFNTTWQQISTIHKGRRWTVVRGAVDPIPRNTKGLNHPNCTLTEKDVLEIRQLYSSGVSQLELRKLYPQVRPPALWKIVHRRTWTHI